MTLETNMMAYAYAKFLRRVLLLSLFLCLSLDIYGQEQSDQAAHNSPTEYELLLQSLLDADFEEKLAIVQVLGQSQDQRALALLMAMRENELYKRKEDKRLVRATKSDNGYSIIDLRTLEDLGEVAKRSVKKIRVNTSLRGIARTQVALLELQNPLRKVRLSSAKNLIRNPSQDLREAIVAAKAKESDAEIRKLLDLALAQIDINSDDSQLRFSALQTLASSVEPEVVASVRRLTLRDKDGNFLELNQPLALAAEEKLKAIETKLDTYRFAENIIFGLSLGSVLLLAAIGLAITFGVMGVINMAHGEMIMLGAYTTFAIQQLFPSAIGISLFLAIPAAFIVSGGMGILIERLVIRHMYGRPLDTLLATFGISLILQQAVRTFNSNNVPVITPDWMSGSWVINGAMSVTYNRLYILLFSFVVLAVLVLVMKKTLFGLQMRAVTQNRAMATSMGIRSSWVDALTFGLGSGIAGMAGVALSQITNVGPNLGQSYIIDSFMVVVFGGVGNLFGTFFAAMSLGVVNKFLEPYAGAVLGKIMVLVFIILFIQWRPRGLFALRGRFVED